MKGRSFQTREGIFLVVLAASLGAPLIPFGGVSLYAWVSQYTLDVIGGYETGYIQTFLISWLICLMPLLLWRLVSTSLLRLRTLDDLRGAFRVGMSEDEFFTGCDKLNIGRPAPGKSQVSIFVEEGDAVVFSFAQGALTHANYQGSTLWE